MFWTIVGGIALGIVLIAVVAIINHRKMVIRYRINCDHWCEAFDRCDIGRECSSDGNCMWREVCDE